MEAVAMTLEGLQGWPAAVAMLVGGLLLGLRIYLQFKRDFRSDQGHGVVASGYNELIATLRAELVRKTEQIEHLQKQLDDLQSRHTGDE